VWDRAPHKSSPTIFQRPAPPWVRNLASTLSCVPPPPPPLRRVLQVAHDPLTPCPPASRLWTLQVTVLQAVGDMPVEEYTLSLSPQCTVDKINVRGGAGEGGDFVLFRSMTTNRRWLCAEHAVLTSQMVAREEGRVHARPA